MTEGQEQCEEWDFLAPYYSFAMPYAILERWLRANEGGLR